MIKLTKLMTILLALCLITTSFAGSTLAKFTTGASANDIARVAKWGVVITPFDGLFSDAYEDSAVVWTEDNGDNSITVRSETKGTNIIAPGTNSIIYGITITGKPEVGVRITHDAEIELTGWEIDVTDDGIDNPEFYCPLVISYINAKTMNFYSFYGLADDNFDGIRDYSSADEFEEAIESVLEENIFEYPPNTDLGATHMYDPYLSWDWAFEGKDGKQTVEKDTALGDASVAALEDDDPYTNPPTISVNITTTVTQID